MRVFTPKTTVPWLLSNISYYQSYSVSEKTPSIKVIEYAGLQELCLQLGEYPKKLFMSFKLMALIMELYYLVFTQVSHEMVKL